MEPPRWGAADHGTPFFACDEASILGWGTVKGVDVRTGKQRISATAVVTVMAASALVTVAQAADSQGPQAVGERPWGVGLAGFGAFTVGGHFKSQGTSAADTGTVDLADHSAFAVAADLATGEGSQYELFYSREATDLRGNFGVPRTAVTVEYLHIGGTVSVNDEPRIQPYVTGGLGVTRLTPGADGSTDTRFSASLGLGLRVPVTQHFSARLEARGFVTLLSADNAIFCRSDQTGLLCRIHSSGQSFIQGEFLAGAAFAF
jgi:opacity protein-like surface antigen